MVALLLKDIHESWAWVVIIGNAFAGAWALAAHRLTQLRSRALWWFTGFVEFAVFVQVAMGVTLVSKYKLTLHQFHAFYGFVAIIAVAILYSYRAQLKSKIGRAHV